MKTISQVRVSFWESFPEYKQYYAKNKRQNQYFTDIRCAFVQYVDFLLKNGTISEKLANNVTL